MLDVRDEVIGPDDVPYSHPVSECRRPGVVVAARTPLMRFHLATYLEVVGFEVWAVGSGVEVLDAAVQHRGKVDVLFVEADLPDLPAPALYDRLQTHLPAVPCCFFAPSAEGRFVADVRAMGATVVVWPVSVDQLADTLWAEVLAATVLGT